jgi:hypothetical protein
VILWIDAQLSPAMAPWISDTFGVAAHAIRDLGLREATEQLRDVLHKGFPEARARLEQGEPLVEISDAR